MCVYANVVNVIGLPQKTASSMMAAGLSVQEGNSVRHASLGCSVVARRSPPAPEDGRTRGSDDFITARKWMMMRGATL